MASHLPSDDASHRVSSAEISTRESTYLDLAQLAAAGVRGCDAAGITMIVDGVWTTVAATDGVVLDVDSAQYRRDDGPCLTAVRSDAMVQVDDFAVESRWSGVANEACAAGIFSSLSVPLRDGRHIVGGLNLYAKSAGVFTSEDRRAAEVIGRQGGMALQYLRLLDAERRDRAAEHAISEFLQRSLLPTLPHIRGLECAARYLPGAHDAQVGGDWYDVFPLPDGAVGIAVGDVMGHDVVAAAAMGQLRSVLRSYAYEGSTPALVLDRMDRLVQSFDMAQLATAFYGRLLLDHEGALLMYANAGHLPPLLRHADGTLVTVTGAASRLIGAPADEQQSRSEAALAIAPGSTLLMFTDGLVESRSLELDEGMRRLTEAVSAVPVDADLEGLVDAVVARLVQPRPDDDVAVLAVRVSPPVLIDLTA